MMANMNTTLTHPQRQQQQQKQQRYHHEEDSDDFVPLEFACRDSSKGVTDFREWSYFQRQEKKKIINIGNTHLWSKSYLKMLDERKIDTVKAKSKTKKSSGPPPVRSTKAQRMREKYNEQISASYTPALTVSVVGATIDTDSLNGNDVEI